MQESLARIVSTMLSLGFRDDDYRNSSEAGQGIGLQYFFKRNEGSESWEVYSTWNPYSSLLSLHYYDIYGNESPHPAFFIRVDNDQDAAIACELLQLKTDYLWSPSSRPKKPATTAHVAKELLKSGFVEQSQANKIATWVKGTGTDVQTALVENGVSLSVYLFSGDPKGKARPILSLRSIHDDGCWEVVSEYVKRKALLVP